ncbi:alpha/beta fold hydrolase [Faucicola mancuniensis]|uniref:alpha/beta fold hydrolase n=1 Tax=Faucicola mancuniensis TaxID=1309795 RepID=UPI003977379B
MNKNNMKKNNSLPPVILLHGLHMHAWAMKPLANQLAQQGFDTHVFGYYSMMHPIHRHSERLNHWLLTKFEQNQPLYLVGHSLGGLVIRDFLHRYPTWQVPRVVTLGTPHNGSLSANRIVKILPTFIGQSYHHGLDGLTAPLPNTTSLGSIAGNLSAGLGRVVLPKNANENDGTVLLSETILPNQTDHIILPVSHTGMIFNNNVAKQVGYFLQHNHFFHD